MHEISLAQRPDFPEGGWRRTPKPSANTQDAANSGGRTGTGVIVNLPTTRHRLNTTSSRNHHAPKMLSRVLLSGMARYKREVLGAAADGDRRGHGIACRGDH